MLSLKAKFTSALSLFGLTACIVYFPVLSLEAATGSSHLPVPYISWQDIKALYPPHRHIGDWDFPKVDKLPHRSDLIERCNQDLRLSLKSNPDPFQMNRALPTGKLQLIAITKDPDSRIIYFVFSYESELITDLRIIYYYDPEQDRFILKSTA
jgi:hypothetical protein